MGRVNVSYREKQSISDIFTLTNIETDESISMIPSDSEGNFNYRGIIKAPVVRNAMQTSQTSGEYSDLEYPWMAIPQEDWTGGRGNIRFTVDKTRYLDGKRAQTSFNQVIYNAPLEYYSKGFRIAETNYPGSMQWMKMISTKQKYIAVRITPAESFDAGEIYIHLRRRGTPVSPLVVELVDELNGEALTSHSYTVGEITDTLAEFPKFTFDAVSLTAGTDYYIRIHTENGTSEDYWQVGYKMNYEPNTFYSADGETYIPANFEIYYRIAEAQEDYRVKFFLYEQLVFMVRQKPNGVPKVYINGLIAKCSSATSDTITVSSAGWDVNKWKDARIGLVYRHGIEGQNSVWRKVVSNTADTITVDKNWDVTPQNGTIFIITDSPYWTEITGHGLTSAVTDVHVIRGVVYFAQGDYTNVRKMRWNDGSFEWMELTGIKATFLQSVRDNSGTMLYRGRNDDDNHKRSVERSRLLDWEEPRVTPTFDATVGYVKGDYVIYDDKLYRFKEDHSAGAWNSGHVDDMTITPGENDFTPPSDPEGRIVAIIKNAVTTNGGTVIADSVDFGACDYDARMYVVDITTFSSEKNTGSLIVTLQESEDNVTFFDVQSITAYGMGRYYLEAHCQYPYRRIKFTASGTNCSVNNIVVKTTNILHFEDATTLLDNYGKITRLFEYGAEQEKFLWIFQEGMVSSINKTIYNNVATYHLDRINIDELVTTSEEWNGKAVNSSDVYLVWAWLNGLQRYYNTQLEGKGPDHDEGLPFERRGRVTQIVSYPSNFFISIDADDGYSCAMQFNQNGWAELYRAPNADERIHDMIFQSIYGERPDRLWISVGDDVIWLAMPSKILYAIQDQNAEYTHESVVVSAWITGGMAEVRKLWQSLSIMADYLDGKNCLIEADYQLDNENNAWIPVPDNPYTISPTEEKTLSNRRKPANGNRLRYRLRLQTTDIHKTPKVNVVLIKAIGVIDIKYSYSFTFRNIKYKADLTGEYEEIEPYEVDEILDRWAKDLAMLRLNSAYKIYDDKIVFLDAPQTSVVTEKKEGYLSQITLTEI